MSDARLLLVVFPYSITNHMNIRNHVDFTQFIMLTLVARWSLRSWVASLPRCAPSLRSWVASLRRFAPSLRS